MDEFDEPNSPDKKQKKNLGRGWYDFYYDSEKEEEEEVESPLPNGWRAKTTGYGALYYVNDVLEITSWVKPSEPALSPGWEVRYHAEKKYYANNITRKTQWHNPDGLQYNSVNEETIEQPDFEEGIGGFKKGSKLPTYSEAVEADFPGRQVSKYPMPTSEVYSPQPAINPDYEAPTSLPKYSSLYTVSMETPPDYMDSQYDIAYIYGDKRNSASWCEVCKRMGRGFFCQLMLTMVIWSMIIFACINIWHFKAVISILSVGWLCLICTTCQGGSGNMCNGYLENVNYGDPYKYEKEMKETRGSIKWHVQCYHIEIVEEKDARGQSSKARKVRHNTHSASMVYEYENFRDVSHKLRHMNDYKLMQLKTIPRWGFADEEIKKHYNRNLKRWRKHHDRDEKQDFSMTWHLPNMKARSLWVREAGALPYCANSMVYCFFSCFTFGFLYRLWFEKKSGRQEWVCEKEISGIVHGQKFID